MLSEAPQVSVIIPTFNQSGYLVEAIKSVLSQTYTSLEVIVVDDGSTDNTAEVVGAFDSRVRYLRQSNKGTAAARNAGIAHAKGKWIAFLDHDDLWMPEKLALQIPLFEADPKLGLVYAAIRFFDDRTGRITCEHFPGPELGFHDLLGHQVISLQTSVFPKGVLQEVGGFDESLFGTDDWDLCIRVTARYAAKGVATPLVNIRLHDAHASYAAERMYENEWAVVNKNAGMHQNCVACRAALRRTARMLRASQYGRRVSRAKAELGQGKYLSSITTRCEAILRYPIALARVPRRAMEAMTGRQS